MAWIAPVVAAGATVAGGMMGGFAQHEANDVNQHIADQNRQFEADMSNTAYQRATADMKAAGLNPMLAYSQGGASSPGGSVIPRQAELAPSQGISTAATVAAEVAKKVAETKTEDVRPAQVIQDTRTSAMQERNFMQDIQTKGQAINESVAKTRNLVSENAQIEAAVDLTMNQVTKTGVEIENLAIARQHVEAQIRSLGIDQVLRLMEIPAASNMSEMQKTWWGKVLPYIQSVLAPLSTAGSAYAGAKAASRPINVYKGK